MNAKYAKRIIKDKIIGVTCHNSIKLAKIALLNKANYIAIGAFYQTKTKKVKHKANIQILKKIKKLVNLPIVAIGGINEKNYKKLLLNKADFLAISGYIWNNKKYKPHQAIKNLK
jgi:thiamine-phosphate pyrophosphorylase